LSEGSFGKSSPLSAQQESPTASATAQNFHRMAALYARFRIRGCGRRPATEEISGLIERVTFHNGESGFCVLRVKAPGQREETTVVGSLPSVAAGEWLNAEGRWVRDTEHGLQFKAITMKTVPPTTAEGIERYLGSGLVKGIGPILAKNLVGRFGAEVLAVIENRAAELQTVDGIGPKRRGRIAHAWQEAKQVREIMLFLHCHRVSTSRAVRIFKTYGEKAIEKVRSNPYTLAKDVYGIGFMTADQIARKVGIPRDSINRARAGIDHVLLEATSDGHCALPRERLKLAAVKLLEAMEGTVEQALTQMLTGGSLLLEDIDGDALIFLPHLRRAEEGIAARIKSLAATELVYPPIDFEKAVASCERRTGKTLAPSQREALRTVLANRVVVITGGPGVGKTTLVKLVRERIPERFRLDPIRDVQVLCPIATQHYMLLQRNLIYTGITRGKRLLVLIGQKKALGIAVRNDRPQRRYTGLLASLEGKKGTGGSAVDSKTASQSRVVPASI